MKAVKNSTYFAMSILLIAAITVVASLRLSTFQSRFLPLAIGIAIAFLSGIRIFSELKAEQPDAESEKKPVSQKSELIAMIFTGAWLVGFCLMIYLIGFPLAILVFVTSYIRARHYGWIKSFAIGFGTSSVTYITFDLAMDMDLYKGVLVSYLSRTVS